MHDECDQLKRQLKEMHISNVTLEGRLRDTKKELTILQRLMSLDGGRNDGSSVLECEEYKNYKFACDELLAI